MRPPWRRKVRIERTGKRGLWVRLFHHPVEGAAWELRGLQSSTPHELQAIQDRERAALGRWFDALYEQFGVPLWDWPRWKDHAR